MSLTATRLNLLVMPRRMPYQFYQGFKNQAKRVFKLILSCRLLLSGKSLLKQVFTGDSLGAKGSLSSKDSALVAKILSSKLTYLTSRKMESILKSVCDIELKRVPGIFIEAGCALGGSSILIAKKKATTRQLNIYDVFGVIPPPSENDTPDVHVRYKQISDGKSEGIAGDKYYGYEENLYEIVISNLSHFGVEPATHHVFLIKGLLQETMRLNEPVAFAHIDVDWYEPVLTCLSRIVPRLSPGGILILDDYHDWGGCRKAVDEYFSESSDDFVFDDSAGSMKVTRLPCD